MDKLQEEQFTRRKCAESLQTIQWEHPKLKPTAGHSTQKHQQEEIYFNSLDRILQEMEPLGKPLFSYRCTPVKQKKKYLDSLMR